MKQEPAGNNPDFYKSSRFDWVLTALILCLAFGPVFNIIRQRFLTPSQERKALICQEKNLLEEVDLGQDKTVSLLGGKMQLEVKNRRIRVLYSDCPQHICVNMGWIGYSGQTLVCVPNKVIVEIKSKSPSLLDAVSY